MFRKSERGGSLIAAVFLVLILAMMGVIVTVYTISSAEEAGNEYLSVQAFYYAETGIYAALTDITDNNTLNVTSYTFNNPEGVATITANKAGTVWILECTATAGDPSTQKFGKRTIRVLFED